MDFILYLGDVRVPVLGRFYFVLVASLVDRSKACTGECGRTWRPATVLNNLMPKKKIIDAPPKKKKHQNDIYSANLVKINSLGRLSQQRQVSKAILRIHFLNRKILK